MPKTISATSLKPSIDWSMLIVVPLPFTPNCIHPDVLSRQVE